MHRRPHGGALAGRTGGLPRNAWAAAPATRPYLGPAAVAEKRAGFDEPRRRQARRPRRGWTAPPPPSARPPGPRAGAGLRRRGADRPQPVPPFPASRRYGPQQGPAAPGAVGCRLVGSPCRRLDVDPDIVLPGRHEIASPARRLVAETLARDDRADAYGETPTNDLGHRGLARSSTLSCGVFVVLSKAVPEVPLGEPARPRRSSRSYWSRTPLPPAPAGPSPRRCGCTSGHSPVSRRRSPTAPIAPPTPAPPAPPARPQPTGPVALHPSPLPAGPDRATSAGRCARGYVGCANPIDRRPEPRRTGPLRREIRRGPSPPRNSPAWA